MTFQKETMTQAIQSTSAVQIVHATAANIYTPAKDSVGEEDKILEEQNVMLSRSLELLEVKE